MSILMPVFSPLQYRPSLYYTPFEPSSITKDGSNLVSQWSDISGVGNNATQGTGANQFTYTASAINGRPAMLGNGSSTFMTLSSTITLTGELTIFWSAQASSLAAGGGIIAGSTSTSRIGTSNSSLGNFSLRVVNGGSVDTAVAHPAVGVAYIGMLRRDSSNKVDLSINNGSLTRLYSDAAQAGSMVLERLGRENTPLSWNGYIGHILVYPSALTIADYTKVAQFLSSRTGIAVT